MMRYLDQTELAFLKPNMFFLVTEYKGEIDEKALEVAFGYLCTRYPVLRGCIEQDENGYLFKVSKGARPEFDTIDGDFSLILRKFDEPDTKFGQNLGRLILTREGNRGYVSFGLHHALAGAGVAYEYLRQLWDLYTRVVESSEISVSAGRIPPSPSQVLEARRIYGEPSREAVHGPTLDMVDMIEGSNRCIRLTEDETLHIYDVAKSQKLSVGSLWAGVATSAVVEFDKSITIDSVRIGTLVDLGRYISPPISIMESTYFVGPTSIEVSTDDNSIAIAHEFDKKYRVAAGRTRPATADEISSITYGTEVSINNGGLIAPFKTPEELDIIELLNPYLMMGRNLVPGGKRRLGITLSTYHKRTTVALSTCLEIEHLIAEICRQFKSIGAHVTMHENIGAQV